MGHFHNKLGNCAGFHYFSFYAPALILCVGTKSERQRNGISTELRAKLLLTAIQTAARSGRTVCEFPKQTLPILLCHARLASFMGQNVGIRESADLMSIRSRYESFYRHKHSEIKV